MRGVGGLRLRGLLSPCPPLVCLMALVRSVCPVPFYFKTPVVLLPPLGRCGAADFPYLCAAPPLRGRLVLRTMVKKREEAARMAKFVVVGVMNTAVTYVVYVALRALGVGIFAANLAGYVAGVANSFVWSRRWVFRRRTGHIGRQAALFVAGFGLCYGVQWLALRALLAAGVGEYVAQLLAMCVYTGLNFLFNRCLTFR